MLDYGIKKLPDCESWLGVGSVWIPSWLLEASFCNLLESRSVLNEEKQIARRLEIYKVKNCQPNNVDISGPTSQRQKNQWERASWATNSSPATKLCSNLSDVLTDPQSSSPGLSSHFVVLTTSPRIELHDQPMDLNWIRTADWSSLFL